ncbi:MAG: hypothetical protein ABH842_02955 [Candidatus Micrarchaeota archaeon]
MMDFFVVEPCSSSNGIEVKLNGKKIDLKKAENALPSVGTSSVVILSKFQNYSVSLYASGRIMIKGNKKISSKVGEKLAKKLIDLLEKNHAIVD